MLDTALFDVVKFRRLPTWYEVSERLAPLESESSQWLFRGQQDVGWGLRTSLERAAFDAAIETSMLPDSALSASKRSRAMEELYRTVPFQGLGPHKSTLAVVEAALIRQFKRRTHHFSVDTPHDKDFPEWLSLMQHFGAPTRLLDWTYSFYVGCFFALESVTHSCAIWAIDSHWLNEAVRHLFAEHGIQATAFDRDFNCRTPRHFRELFQPAAVTGRPALDARTAPRLPFVCAMNPYRQNPRLTIQQASFLVTGDVNRSFEENLEALLHRSATPRLMKMVFDLDHAGRREALRQLYRMNMNRATLFPGLEGFAQSLTSHMLIGQTLAADPDEFQEPY